MKILRLSIFFIILNMFVAGVAMSLTPPGPNEVSIGKTAIRVPLGYIMLVRKDSEFCAVKFTEIKNGKTQEEWIAKYESYYQGDKTGDFTNKNVQLKKGDLLETRLYGIGRLAFSFGNRDIQCGSSKLGWSRVGWIMFFEFRQEEGDYGIELAPTKWTDVSQINILDQRLKWYRFDPKRERESIPIDKFWEEKE